MIAAFEDRQRDRPLPACPAGLDMDKQLRAFDGLATGAAAHGMSELLANSPPSAGALFARLTAEQQEIALLPLTDRDRLLLLEWSWPETADFAGHDSERSWWMHTCFKQAHENEASLLRGELLVPEWPALIDHLPLDAYRRTDADALGPIIANAEPAVVGAVLARLSDRVTADLFAELVDEFRDAAYALRATEIMAQMTSTSPECYVAQMHPDRAPEAFRAGGAPVWAALYDSIEWKGLPQGSYANRMLRECLRERTRVLSMDQIKSSIRAALDPRLAAAFFLKSGASGAPPLPPQTLANALADFKWRDRPFQPDPRFAPTSIARHNCGVGAVGHVHRFTTPVAAPSPELSRQSSLGSHEHSAAEDLRISPVSAFRPARAAVSPAAVP